MCSCLITIKHLLVGGMLGRELREREQIPSELDAGTMGSLTQVCIWPSEVLVGH